MSHYNWHPRENGDLLDSRLRGNDKREGGNDKREGENDNLPLFQNKFF